MPRIFADTVATLPEILTQIASAAMDVGNGTTPSALVWMKVPTKINISSSIVVTNAR